MKSETSRGPTDKSPAQRDRILALLRERGRAGVTNLELNTVCFRYGARIWELRKQGFAVETRREGDSVFRFVLHTEPQAPREIPTYEQRTRELHAEAMPLFAGVR